MNALVESPFAAQQHSRTSVAETSSAMQAQARELAEMQTKFLMAEKFPRDERKSMDGILNAFSRRTLAEIACYEFSKGGSNVSGLSVHSMQAIAQQWGNMEFGWTEVSRGTGTDGTPYSEVRAFAWDLQSRTCRPLQFIVRHWRDTKQGGYKLKDEREIYELCANMAQRRVRSCLEAVIPKDVQDAAEQQAAATLKANADTSPEAMQKMVDAFAPFGVTKEKIEKRIQRRLDAIAPAQVVMLKRIYTSLRDQVSTAAEWFEMDEAPTPTEAGASLEAVKAAAASKKAGKAPAAAAPAQQQSVIPPTFDVPATIAKIKAATDRETLALMADEFRDMADGADKQALIEASKARDAELAGA